MKLHLDDPRLTAYALGELEGAEAAEMKKMIEENPEALQFVRDIQGTADLLTAEFSKEEEVPLTREMRTKLHKLAEPKKKFSWQWLSLSGGLVAAGVVAVVISREQYSQVAVVPEEVAKVEAVQQTAEPVEEAYTFAKDTTIAGEGESRFRDEETKPASPIRYRRSSPSAIGKVAGGYVKQESVNARPVKDASKVGLYATLGAGGQKKSLDKAYSDGDDMKMGYGAKARMAAPVNTDYENYASYKENEITNVVDQALSTFSIDVDTASYSNVRRMLVKSQWPQKDAVRLEEMVNYFNYNYAPPTDGKPFATHIEVATSPWNKKAKLMRIALKGKEIAEQARPPANLVFLIDTSGSMDEENKLPLVKRSLNMLVDKMRPQDRIALVTYAGSSGVALDSTSGEKKMAIKKAIEELSAAGGTNGASGIELAYEQAKKSFIKEGTNRVILATDGDFNIGTTSEGDLNRLIESKAKSGVFLSVLGFGYGNLKDNTMQKLADKGNGNYAYIDTLREARKTLIEQSGGTLVTIAKDVKIQVEFNPKYVSKYRLVGYEKRILAAQDFNDDTKDAGEIGAGHTVTAFYEIYPAAGEPAAAKVDALKYQDAGKPKANESKELATVKLRFKAPTGDKSELIEVPVQNVDQSFDSASSDFKFAACVAEFGQMLKDSQFKGESTYSQLIEIASANTKLKDKEDPYRKEFVELIKKAQYLKGK